MKQLLGIFVLLVALCCCTTEAGRNRMRAELDSINVLNRNDQPFTVQDVEPYVQFFDEHGTPNDRLLAHYLLGRAYYEAGEAPMALECYQKAAECADTTSKDCDYRQLCRVYAQMAEVFYYQGLYRLQLNSEKLSVRYAWLGGDTIAALMNYEQESFAYNDLGIQDSAILIIEDVAEKFEKYGYPADAAISIGTISKTLIDKGEYEKAKLCMDRYESESGLFNEDGEIQIGRERYYNVKGLYYYKRRLLDSAEYWYRKELGKGKDFNNQNGGAFGLAMVYEQRHIMDSTAKYFQYAYAMNDSMFAHTNIATIGRIQSMYNYSHHQKEARIEREKATERLVLIWITIAVILLLTAILVIILFILQHVRQKRKAVERQYRQSLMAIEQARKDISQLHSYREQNKSLIAEKERLIVEQEIIRKNLLKNERTGQEIALKQFKDSAIFQVFCKYSDCGKQPARTDWPLLQDALFNAYPNFSELMTAHCQTLSDREYKVCLLIRAGFKPNTISNMLGTLPSVITQLRTELFLKLFRRQGTSKEFDILIKKVY